MNPPEPAILIPHRDLLGQVLNQAGLLGQGCEIGVQEGKFSEVILQNWHGQKLYSLDPWQHFGEKEYLDLANRDQAAQDLLYENTQKRLACFGERSVILRQTSVKAAEAFTAEQLDFAYIDAQHTYEAVAKDMRIWFPKIKPGGILCGDDYIPDGLYTFGLFGVKRAVDEFAARRNLQVFISGEVSPDPKIMAFRSWFIVKSPAS